MSMQISLPLDIQGYIQDKVRAGSYANAGDVIKEALRRMQDEEVRVMAWREAIRIGDEQLANGEGIVYTPEVLRDIVQCAREAMYGDQPIDPDVLP